MSKEKEDFQEYKHFLLDNVQQFKGCREEHRKEFYRLHDSMENMEKNLIKEMKDLRSLADRIDRRLIIVEVKSGAFGALAGALVPLILKYFQGG
jgi:hypothetical protein